MRDEKTDAAAIDVVDASDEKDERKDPPAQARYGSVALSCTRDSGWVLSDCAPSALLFQGDVTGRLPWKKTERGDCSNVYGMCYCLRVLTITYRNVPETNWPL